MEEIIKELYYNCKITYESNWYLVKHKLSNQYLYVRFMRDAFFSARLLELDYRIFGFLKIGDKS